MTVTTALHDSVLLVTIDNPPVNALGHAVRAGLMAAVRAGADDPAVAVVVIACAGRTFCAGADITEFGKPPAPPLLAELCETIERLETPVVAAIHGAALGGGLEVALGCHYRIAVPSAKLGTPEVKLGLLPGAGGTQRLPRLIGVEAALEMIALGNPMSAGRAAELGLIDRLASEGSLVEDALAFARVIAAVRPLPRASDRVADSASAAFDRFAAAHERKLKGQDAPAACIEAVRAATDRPFAGGIALEGALFRRLVAGEQSAALRHVFFAERKAAKIDDLDPAVAPLPIASVGVVGAGLMGSGIAINFLMAGMAVTLLETSREALDRGVANIHRIFESNVAKGRMTADAAARATALLRATRDYDDLADCDLIIEAVFELMEVKHKVFAQLDAVARPGAILATNTSYLDIDAIAAVTRRPESVIGLHFFSPAHIMKLLEVVRAAGAAPQVLATAMALAKRIGKIAVVSRVCHGFIGNRLLAVRRAQAFELLLDGATPQQVDEAHVAFGMPMGPFQMSDLAGVDIGWHRDSTRIESIRDALCAAGRLGQKAGKGYYDYDDARRAHVSPEARAIIADFAHAHGRAPRAITAEEILERTLYPMVNEGAQILAEGVAQRASDIDVVWVNGYGWPAWRGGPMFWGDQAGLDRIAERLAAYGLPVSPLLAEKAAAGARFCA